MYEYVYAKTEGEKRLRSLTFCLHKETADEEEREDGVFVFSSLECNVIERVVFLTCVKVTCTR